MIELQGYHRKRYRVTFRDGREKKIAIRLKSRIGRENIVDVTAMHPDKWNKLYNKFKVGFLGKSTFAEKCEFLNKDVIQFNETDSSIIITSKEPIKITNHGLAYDIAFTVNHCEIDREGKLIYSINTKFKDIKEKYDSKIIVRNRYNAYLNSKKRFFSLLYKGSSELSDFYNIGELIEAKRYKATFYKLYYKNVNNHSIIKPHKLKHFKMLWSKRPIAIEHLQKDLLDQDWNINHKYSQILFDKKAPFLIDKDGNTAFLSKNVSFVNYFGFLRIAGLLPEDYLPGIK